MNITDSSQHLFWVAVWVALIVVPSSAWITASISEGNALEELRSTVLNRLDFYHSNLEFAFDKHEGLPLALTRNRDIDLLLNHPSDEDLYFRLHVVAINIPSLRERREDIPLLFQHFASLAAARYKRDVPPLESSRIHRLISHVWPGNVRELRNVAERYDLGFSEESDGAAMVASTDYDAGTHRSTLSEQVDLFERTIIEGELVKQQGNVKDTCEALGLPRKTFYDKLRHYGLRRDDYTG